MLDLNKPVQTRGGLKARIICKDIKGDYPIAVVITTESGGELLERYSSQGRWPAAPIMGPVESPTDLINVPAENVEYVNMYVGDPRRPVAQDNAEIAFFCAAGDVADLRFYETFGGHPKACTVRVVKRGDKVIRLEVV